MSEHESTRQDVADLLRLAHVQVDDTEAERLAAAYDHYRVGLDALDRMEVPPGTRPYLVPDVDHASARR